MSNSTINLNNKSRVRNLCSWPVSWSRETMDSDEYIKGNQVTYITNSEIETQVQNGNSFFCGTDSIGSHARVYIENPEMREHLEFDNKEEKRTQKILTDDRCKEIFEYKTFKTFKKHVIESIVTNQEKDMIIKYAKKAKVNEFDKVQFLESHCGIPFKNQNQEQEN